jgi:hypothetical protein
VDVKLSRRAVVLLFTAAPVLAVAAKGASPCSGPQIDVNNAMAREFTAFPGYARRELVILWDTVCLSRFAHVPVL